MNIHAFTQHFLSRQGIESLYMPEVDSTNTWAKKSPSSSPLTAFFSDRQTQGRGRGSNTWSQSQPGDTLLSTWSLRLESAPQPIFPIRVGLVLFECLRSTWPELSWGMKAPNDIYLGDGKFAGILIEVTQAQSIRCYIGLGANIFSAPRLSQQKTEALFQQTSFSEDQWSLFCQRWLQQLRDLQKDPSRSSLLPQELQRLELALQAYPQNPIQSVQADGSVTLKNNVQIHWSEL